MQFHISRQARDHYHFDLELFSFNGNVILADFHAARLFAQKVNQKRDLSAFPEKAVKAGQINAMGLMDEIFHLVCSLYREHRQPHMLAEAHAWLEKELGKDALDHLIIEFTTLFPPPIIYQGKQTIKKYLSLSTDGIPNRHAIIEELIVLWINNNNPALNPFIELFDDQNLQTSSEYRNALSSLQQFFCSLPPFGPEEKSLIEMLQAPAKAEPYSLPGQLEYIRTHWAGLLGKYLYRLLSSMDLIKEEEKFDFMSAGFGDGVVSIPVYDRSLSELESERFSQDRDWMPQLVLLAKNSYVWLDQLSKKYQRDITKLDQIPDGELDEMAAWGMTGLWLIGLWERSRASARIKQMCGNPEAVASAYSLFDYRIADDLGGETAYENLRQRAWQRGIRLASDMVPNHMGIDSPWVVENPDWFISLNHSPFPIYTFDGPDLSPDSRVGIYLEDHYYSRTDASVVFKRVDHQSGDTRFIYHGNDGTSMPWNDTAQLNYLNPIVREQVIQTILQVARRFPVIRFDAAMTLAKRHYQRLWYPEPGSGGDIPTRSEYGMTKDEFDRAFPLEFWREVVDRVAAEAPDTLLLAEAFWLMESYFVRTLGMHRVYNSAFMHLLRNEDNAKYRTLMKNTLAFDPEILKRYVNFMNNPDERTAIDQFGNGNKYFGICTLMATMPGLPMFGHGQVQGFTEKYGMEYRRAYYEEIPDSHLVDRHIQQIFPLLHLRNIFAEVDNFLLYDLITPGGWVDENVFAYSNSHQNHYALVIYHNRFASTSGWIKTSAASANKTGAQQNELVQKTVAQGLNLTSGTRKYLIFREHNSGLQYIRPVNEIIEKGLFFSLEAYQTLVFLDFQVVEDNNNRIYQQVFDWLHGSGVPDLKEAMQEIALQPITAAFHQIINQGYFNYLISQSSEDSEEPLSAHLIPEAHQKISVFLDGIQTVFGHSLNQSSILKDADSKIDGLINLFRQSPQKLSSGSSKLKKSIVFIQAGLMAHPHSSLILWCWVFLHAFGKTSGDDNWAERTRSWFDEWRLSKNMDQFFQQYGLDSETRQRYLVLFRILLSQQNWAKNIIEGDANALLQTWLEDGQIQHFIQLNRYNDVLWLNAESFEELIWWLQILAWLQIETDTEMNKSEKVETLLAVEDFRSTLYKALKKSGYRAARLLELFKKSSTD